MDGKGRPRGVSKEENLLVRQAGSKEGPALQEEGGKKLKRSLKKKNLNGYERR